MRSAGVKGILRRRILQVLGASGTLQSEHDEAKAGRHDSISHEFSSSCHRGAISFVIEHNACNKPFLSQWRVALQCCA
jgi:hypothetical protein